VPSLAAVAGPLARAHSRFLFSPEQLCPAKLAVQQVAPSQAAPADKRLMHWEYKQRFLDSAREQRFGRDEAPLPGR